MRAGYVILVSLGLLGLQPALAQAPTTPGAAPDSASRAATRGGDISRDDYIQKAVDRARRAAEKRFDQMDADHDGILTADERRAYRAERRRQRESESQ